MKRSNPSFATTRLVCLTAALLLLLPNFLPVHLFPLSNGGHTWEVFDPNAAAQLRSIDTLEAHIDAAALASGVTVADIGYGNLVAKTVRERFYHGYSHYALNENWIAAISGRLFWEHLSAIVNPDHLLQYPMAACSQQSIVVMELFRRKGIPFRKVGFDHHFALEGRFRDGWYFFDTDLEPDFTKYPRTSYAVLEHQDALLDVYHQRLDSAGFNTLLANQFYGTPNAAPAPNALLFHAITGVLSKTMWTLPLLALFGVWYRRRKKAVVRSRVQHSFTISPRTTAI